MKMNLLHKENDEISNLCYNTNTSTNEKTRKKGKLLKFPVRNEKYSKDIICRKTPYKHDFLNEIFWVIELISVYIEKFLKK